MCRGLFHVPNISKRLTFATEKLPTTATQYTLVSEYHASCSLCIHSTTVSFLRSYRQQSTNKTHDKTHGGLGEYRRGDDKRRVRRWHFLSIVPLTGSTLFLLFVQETQVCFWSLAKVPANSKITRSNRCFRFLAILRRNINHGMTLATVRSIATDVVCTGLLAYGSIQSNLVQAEAGSFLRDFDRHNEAVNQVYGSSFSSKDGCQW